MNILKRENWWIWLIASLLGNNVTPLILGAIMKLYKKNAWYANWRNWVIGAVCFIFPAIIMIYVFMIQMTCLVAAKLEVKGSEYYLSPYIWIILLIIPIVGWLAMVVLYLYLTIATIVALYKGKGEQYIER